MSQDQDKSTFLSASEELEALSALFAVSPAVGDYNAAIEKARTIWLKRHEAMVQENRFHMEVIVDTLNVPESDKQLILEYDRMKMVVQREAAQQFQKRYEQVIRPTHEKRIKQWREKVEDLEKQLGKARDENNHYQRSLGELSYQIEELKRVQANA